MGPRSGVSDRGGGLIIAKGKVMTNMRAVGSTFIISAGGVVVFRSSVELSEGEAGEVVVEGVVRIPVPNLRGGAKLS